MTCAHRSETARALTQADALRHVEQLAHEFRAELKRLTGIVMPLREAHYRAQQQLLLKKPTLLITCNHCKKERLE